jgi:hypothetical protein
MAAGKMRNYITYATTLLSVRARRKPSYDCPCSVPARPIVLSWSPPEDGLHVKIGIDSVRGSRWGTVSAGQRSVVMSGL